MLQVSAGEATFGDSDWLSFLDAVAQVNDFVIIAVLFLIPPAGLISLPGAPVRTAADLAGKRFLVQGPNERSMLQALFGIHKLPPDYSPVGFSPEPLLQGAGYVYFCFVTNQPQTLAAMGSARGPGFLRHAPLRPRLPGLDVTADGRAAYLATAAHRGGLIRSEGARKVSASVVARPCC